MEKCQYEAICIGDIKNKDVEKESVGLVPFLKQLLICGAAWMTFFMAGMCLGAPTVITPQLRKEAGSMEAVSKAMASWLPTAYSIGVFPFNIILPIIASYLGRKFTFLIVGLNALVGFVLVYYSTGVLQLFVCLIGLGPMYAGTTTLMLLIMSEYTAPRYRGAFLTAKSASFAWGIWVSNAIGTFVHWKNISLVGIACSLFTLMIVLIIPESPFWLASKGRLEECISSHRWLRGTDSESELELQCLLNSVKNKNYGKNRISIKYIKKYLKACASKEFYKPVLLGFLTFVLYCFSGKIVCTIYAIDIIKKITDSEDTAYYGMLILDGITVLGMYIGCVLTRYLKRRTLLFTCACLGIVLLFALSIYLYVISLSFMKENVVVSICLLLMFSLSISCGPMILCTSIRAEILPIKNRSFALIVISLAADSALGVVIKISPYLFDALKLHGTFMFFGITTTFCVLLLNKYLPETKDKTLQEIAGFMRGDTKKTVLDDKEMLHLASAVTSNH